MQHKFRLIKACICQYWSLATLLSTVHNKLRFGLVLKLITQTMLFFVFFNQLIANLEKLVSHLQDTFGPLQAYLTDTASIFALYFCFEKTLKMQVWAVDGSTTKYAIHNFGKSMLRFILISLLAFGFILSGYFRTLNPLYVTSHCMRKTQIVFICNPILVYFVFNLSLCLVYFLIYLY